jgi:hypothetical protein
MQNIEGRVVVLPEPLDHKIAHVLAVFHDVVPVGLAIVVMDTLDVHILAAPGEEMDLVVPGQGFG